MMDIDVLHAQVVRGSTKVPWGLQLQGGGSQPLIVAQMSISSPAAKIGIQCGDRVTQVQGKSVCQMSAGDVHTLMSQQACTLLLTVERPVDVRQNFESNKQQSQVITPRTAPSNTSQSQNHTSVFKPRPPLWYTPPVKAQPRHQLVTLASSSDLDNYQNGGVLDDVTMSDRQETLSDVALYSGSSVDEEQHPLQYEYHTVHAQPFYRSGRLTPRQRQNTLESRSSSEADQAVTTSSPHSFSSPCYSPTANYSTLSSDTSPPLSSYPYGDIINDAYDDRLPQSRTFRILQSLVFNEVPPSGDQGLPPPRSASQEHRREEEAERKAGGGGGGGTQRQRMCVFMPQQYNSPLRMYSAPNIINTFQDQAEKYFESLERKNRQEQPNYIEDQGFYGY